MDELSGLAEAAGAEVVARALQERSAPSPTTFVGRGKAAALATTCDEIDADVIICDSELTPGQLRHLEAVVSRKVVDRTQLILDIFAARARTREGKLQVELAQLQYLLPRLASSGTSLSRLGGGIGTRGPGETKLETDRRRIRARIHAVKDGIEQVRQRRIQLRGRRHKADVPVVALVGYTNAGKTTLFNRLTHARAHASDALFVTLDPLVRQLSIDQRELLLSDTVGFVERLPHALVAAFRATLEEVVEADLLVHVIDASAPDAERKVAAVRRVLDEVGASNVPVIDVYNKCDSADPGLIQRLEARAPAAICLSARTGAGTEALVDAMASRLALDRVRLTLSFDPVDGADRERISRVYRVGRVLTHEVRDGRVAIVADVPRRIASQFAVVTR